MDIINILRIMIITPIVLMVVVVGASFMVPTMADYSDKDIYDSVDVYRATGNDLYQDLNITQESVDGAVNNTNGLDVGSYQSSESGKEIWELIQKYSSTYGLDPVWVASLVWEESNFNPKANSYDGGTHRGLMQVGPDEFKQYCTTNCAKDWNTDVYGAENNISAGTNLLNYYISRSIHYVGDDRNTVGPLGETYKTAQLIYGVGEGGYLDGAASTAASGISAYNKVVKVYNAYVTGKVKIGDNPGV